MLTTARHWYELRLRELTRKLNAFQDFHPTEPWILTTLYSGMERHAAAWRTVAVANGGRPRSHLVVHFAIDRQDIRAHRCPRPRWSLCCEEELDRCRCEPHLLDVHVHMNTVDAAGR